MGVLAGVLLLAVVVGYGLRYARDNNMLPEALGGTSSSAPVNVENPNYDNRQEFAPPAQDTPVYDELQLPARSAEGKVENGVMYLE